MRDDLRQIPAGVTRQSADDHADVMIEQLRGDNMRENRRFHNSLRSVTCLALSALIFVSVPLSAIAGWWIGWHIP
jgi:hypothetical protein